MWVYIIESLKSHGRRYVGLTTQPRIRLEQHNNGDVRQTAGYVPWGLVAAIWLPDDTAARQLEVYFKSGSGATFHRRHFPPPKLEDPE